MEKNDMKLLMFSGANLFLNSKMKEILELFWKRKMFNVVSVDVVENCLATRNLQRCHGVYLDNSYFSRFTIDVNDCVNFPTLIRNSDSVVSTIFAIQQDVHDGQVSNRVIKNSNSTTNSR